MKTTKHFKVFVYGTLVNFQEYWGLPKTEARLIGTGETVEPFYLFDGGFPLALAKDSLIALNHPGSCHEDNLGRVVGQLWDVSKDVLNRLNRYEGAPDFYSTLETKIRSTMNHWIMNSLIYVGNSAADTLLTRAPVIPDHGTLIWPKIAQAIKGLE